MSYVTQRELYARRADACPDCGQADAADHCAFCERYDAIVADAPQARNIIEFWEALS